MASNWDLHGRCIEHFNFPACKFQIINLLKAKQSLWITDGEGKQTHVDDECVHNDWLDRHSQAVGIIVFN